MNIVPRSNVFSSKATAPLPLVNSATGADIASLIEQVRRDGNWLERIRIRQAMNSTSKELLEHALQEALKASRELVSNRIALDLDTAKKMAVRDNIADTAIIEREIARMTAAIDHELNRQVFEVEMRAGMAEVSNISEAQARLDRGEITEAFFVGAKSRAQARTNEEVQRAESIAKHVIANLGERLAAALRMAERPNY